MVVSLNVCISIQLTADLTRSRVSFRLVMTIVLVVTGFHTGSRGCKMHHLGWPETDNHGAYGTN